MLSSRENLSYSLDFVGGGDGERGMVGGNPANKLFSQAEAQT